MAFPTCPDTRSEVVMAPCGVTSLAFDVESFIALSSIPIRVLGHVVNAYKISIPYVMRHRIRCISNIGGVVGLRGIVVQIEDRCRHRRPR